jgi:hypothetical protein
MLSQHFFIFSQVDGDLTTRNKCSVFYIQGTSVRAVATIGAGAIHFPHIQLCVPSFTIIQIPLLQQQPSFCDLTKCQQPKPSKSVFTGVGVTHDRLFHLLSKNHSSTPSKQPAGMALPSVLKLSSSKSYNTNNPWN